MGNKKAERPRPLVIRRPGAFQIPKSRITTRFLVKRSGLALDRDRAGLIANCDITAGTTIVFRASHRNARISRVPGMRRIKFHDPVYRLSVLPFPSSSLCNSRAQNGTRYLGDLTVGRIADWDIFICPIKRLSARKSWWWRLEFKNPGILTRNDR